METAPVKSQPLHNFSLPLLKWGQKNQMNGNHHRFRRLPESTRPNSPPPPPSATATHKRSSLSEPDSESELENRKLPLGSRTARSRFPFSSCSSQKQQGVVLERESNEGDGEGEKVCGDDEGEESAAKPWNLRPRKSVVKVAAEIGVASKNGESQGVSSTVLAVQQNENLPKSLRLRGFVEGQGSERKEKRKFWISLSREEIEEDVYSMTGSKPARRPKKRPKTVQKQLDNVFPGLYLVGITADSYRVNDDLR